MTVCVAVKTRNAREIRALVLGLCVSDLRCVSGGSILCRYAAQKAGLPALGKVHRIAKVRPAESR